MGWAQFVALHRALLAALLTSHIGLSALGWACSAPAPLSAGSVGCNSSHMLSASVTSGTGVESVDVLEGWGCCCAARLACISISISKTLLDYGQITHECTAYGI